MVKRHVTGTANKMGHFQMRDDSLSGTTETEHRLMDSQNYSYKIAEDGLK